MTEPLKPNQRLVAGEIYECLGIYVPPWLHAALVKISREEKRTMAGLISEILTESIEQPTPKTKCVHLQLPSGAVLRARADIGPRTLEALDEMMRAAVKAISNK